MSQIIHVPAFSKRREARPPPHLSVKVREGPTALEATIAAVGHEEVGFWSELHPDILFPRGEPYLHGNAVSIEQQFRFYADETPLPAVTVELTEPVYVAGVRRSTVLLLFDHRGRAWQWIALEILT